MNKKLLILLTLFLGLIQLNAHSQLSKLPLPVGSGSEVTPGNLYHPNKFGIGTNSVLAQLDVVRNETMGVRFDPTKATLSLGYADGSIRMLFDGNEIQTNHNLLLGSSPSHSILFGNVSTTTWDPQMIIDPNGKVGIGETENLYRKLTIDGGIDLYGEGTGSDVGLLLYHPEESGGTLSRWFLRADLTTGDSYPYLTNRAPNGKVVIKTGTASGGGENTHFTIEGGDGIVDAYFQDADLGIGTTAPWAPLTIKRVYDENPNSTNPNKGIALAFSGKYFSEIGYRFTANGTNSYQVLYNGSEIQWKHYDGSSYVPRMTLTNNGRVGIGISNPTRNLSVAGSMSVGSGSSAGGASEFIEIQAKYNTWNIALENSSDAGFFIGKSGNKNFYIADNSYVGIGTSSPDEKLTVNGKIHAEEIIVDLSVPAPDYVFEPDYNLMSLNELQSYIQNHKHLPEIPSAKEIAEQGVKSGEMDMLLLKKVEELTLYTLEQQKMLDKQKEMINKQEQIIEQQQKQIEAILTKIE